MKEKVILIKKTHWEKINRLFTKLYERADHLHSLFWKDDPIYKQLGRYAEDLRGLIIKTETKQVDSQVARAWEQGFRDGVAFVDEELGDCISDKLDQFAEQGYMPSGQRASSYNWDKVLTQKINRGQKVFLGSTKCHYCSNYGSLCLGGISICPDHESQFHQDYRWNKTEKHWEHIFDLLIEKDGNQYNLYPKGFQEAKRTWSSDIEYDEPEITLTTGKETKLSDLTVLIQDNVLYLGAEKYELVPHPKWETYYGIDISPKSLQILKDYCEEEVARIE
jgi:hypothetical protein